MKNILTVGAGFPSPAKDYEENAIDLAQILMPNPTSSFVVQVSGDSMKECGICDKDYLVVDRSVEVFDGMVVVAYIEQEGFVVKRLKVGQDGYITLISDSAGYKPIVVPEDGVKIFGVVTAKAGFIK